MQTAHPVGCAARGAEGTRTPDPLHAMEVRYQLRYSPAAPEGLASIPTHAGRADAWPRGANDRPRARLH